MNDCLFCKIAQGTIAADIVFEDEFCVCFKDIHPRASTHLLLIPRKHVENLSALKPEDGTLITHMVLKLTEIAHANGLSDGFRTIANTGPGGGQEVYHLHFHILGGKGLKAF